MLRESEVPMCLLYNAPFPPSRCPELPSSVEGTPSFYVFTIHCPPGHTQSLPTVIHGFPMTILGSRGRGEGGNSEGDGKGTGTPEFVCLRFMRHAFVYLWKKGCGGILMGFPHTVTNSCMVVYN